MWPIISLGAGIHYQLSLNQCCRALQSALNLARFLDPKPARDQVYSHPEAPRADILEASHMLS